MDIIINGAFSYFKVLVLVVPHGFLKKKIVEPLFKKAAKKLAPELRELLMLHHLHKKPSHGYEIIKYFQEGAPADLEAKANRIYPSLEKLKKKGFLHLDVDKTHSPKKPRKIYSVTEEGRRHLLAEINELRAGLDALKEYLESMEKDVGA